MDRGKIRESKNVMQKLDAATIRQMSIDQMTIGQKWASKLLVHGYARG